MDERAIMEKKRVPSWQTTLNTRWIHAAGKPPYLPLCSLPARARICFASMSKAHGGPAIPCLRCPIHE